MHRTDLKCAALLVAMLAAGIGSDVSANPLDAHGVISKNRSTLVATICMVSARAYFQNVLAH
jgi:hypothetical protein